MATIELDPDGLRAEYADLMQRASQIKQIIDLLPKIEELARGSKSTSSNQQASHLRPVSKTILEAIGSYIDSVTGSQFTIGECVDWFTANSPGFDPDRHRDSLIFGLRHYVDGEDKRLVILVPGVGRRQQVYGIKAKLSNTGECDDLLSLNARHS